MQQNQARSCVGTNEKKTTDCFHVKLKHLLSTSRYDRQLQQLTSSIHRNKSSRHTMKYV